MVDVKHALLFCVLPSASELFVVVSQLGKKSCSLRNDEGHLADVVIKASELPKLHFPKEQVAVWLGNSAVTIIFF